MLDGEYRQTRDRYARTRYRTGTRTRIRELDRARRRTLRSRAWNLQRYSWPADRPVLYYTVGCASRPVRVSIRSASTLDRKQHGGDYS